VGVINTILLKPYLKKMIHRRVAKDAKLKISTIVFFYYLKSRPKNNSITKLINSLYYLLHFFSLRARRLCGEKLS